MSTVAVVIPLYNHERYAADCLRSVLEQTRPVEKIVIVDDGSSDRSIEIVEKFTDSRITLLRQKNSGQAAATNRGIEAAGACDFVGVLNSDDLYELVRIERCLEFLENNSDREVVCTAFKLIDDAGEELPPENGKVRWMQTVWDARRDTLLAWLGIANFTKTTSNLFGRTGYFREHPFRNYRYVQDYHFALHCAFSEKLAVLSEPLLRYRTHGANTIKSGGLERVTREVIAMNFDLMRELSPRLADSPELRLNYANYFRELVHNHADFRAEVFLALMAGFAPETIPIPEFPELGQPPNRALRKQIAASREATEREATPRESKWFRLGQKLGFVPVEGPKK